MSNVWGSVSQLNEIGFLLLLQTSLKNIGRVKIDRPRERGNQMHLATGRLPNGKYSNAKKKYTAEKLQKMFKLTLCSSRSLSIFNCDRSCSSLSTLLLSCSSSSYITHTTTVTNNNNSFTAKS